MKEHMDANPVVRIQYAAKYAQTANYWKYYIGQSKGLRALDVHYKKEKSSKNLLTGLVLTKLEWLNMEWLLLNRELLL